MKYLYAKIVVLAFFISFFPTKVLASVVINEIAWMGTVNSYNDEWIELYNLADSALNLEGWLIKAVDGTPKIILTGTIPAQGFYLLERTDDDTLPNVVANQVYTGALKNEGEHLEFYDNLGNLVDSVDCSEGWLAGDNNTKATMEKTTQNTWQTSQNPGGTPGAENILVLKKGKLTTEPPAETPAELPSQSVPGTETIFEQKIELKAPSQGNEIRQIYQSGIVINEALPSPEGPDELEEWLELKNLNNEVVDISNWKIQDTVGSTKTYVFPEETKIQANGYLVLPRPTTKITLNNSGDGLKLFQPNNNLIDEIVIEKAPLGQSYNRINSEWFWSTNLTPGSENIIPKAIEEKISSPVGPGATEETETSLMIELKKEGKAAVGETFSERPSLHFLIALILAIFSAILILFLKKNFQESKVHQ